MTIKEIIFDSPIYSKWKNEIEQKDEDGEIEYHELNEWIKDFDERVEHFCIHCQAKRIFSPDSGIYQDTSYVTNSQFPRKKIENKPSHFKTFRCSSSQEHQIFFSFLVDGKNVVKVAEFPSKFDTVKDGFNKYQKIFDKDKLKELAKAAQLESYGYAIAAILYYRRIFEGIILQTFNEAAIPKKVSEADFRKLRMEDKIGYVKKYLPDYFNDNSHMYGILSKGVHELKEEECQEFLPIVKAIIFFSLDEAVDKRNQELRKSELSKKIKTIISKHKK